MSRIATAVLLLWLVPFPAMSQEETACPQSFYEGRIVTAEEVKLGSVPGGAKPLWILGWPCRALYGGMEKGLVKFERGKIREKLYDFQQRLAAVGFRPLFGASARAPASASEPSTIPRTAPRRPSI